MAKAGCRIQSRKKAAEKNGHLRGDLFAHVGKTKNELFEEKDEWHQQPQVPEDADDPASTTFWRMTG